jgi:hypothetical protein
MKTRTQLSLEKQPETTQSSKSTKRTKRGDKNTTPKRSRLAMDFSLNEDIHSVAKFGDASQEDIQGTEKSNHDAGSRSRGIQGTNTRTRSKDIQGTEKSNDNAGSRSREIQGADARTRSKDIQGTEKSIDNAGSRSRDIQDTDARIRSRDIQDTDARTRSRDIQDTEKSMHDAGSCSRDIQKTKKTIRGFQKYLQCVEETDRDEEMDCDIGHRKNTRDARQTSRVIKVGENSQNDVYGESQDTDSNESDNIQLIPAGKKTHVSIARYVKYYWFI